MPTSLPEVPSGADVADRIRRDAVYLPGSVWRAIEDTGVLAAIASVPREEFVPEEHKGWATQDRPLPIGYGQTISQPLIVAVMTAMIEPKSSDRVLEIGTGSGYQAAVLSRLVTEVVSVEVIPELSRSAGMALTSCGISNVELHCGDGRKGWPAKAPYDGIIITACAERVPRDVLAQLAVGGRLIAPLGRGFQRLVLVQRRSDGRFAAQRILPVRFVPLV